MDPKIKDSLEKIRKGATSSLSMSKIAAALGELEGWSFEKQVLTLRRIEDFRMGSSVEKMLEPTMVYSRDLEGTKAQREKMLGQYGLVVPQEDGTFRLDGAELKLGARYYHHVSEVTENERGGYFHAVGWVCVKADRVVAPNGEVFDHWYEDGSKKRSARVHYRFWPWANKHGIKAQVCEALGLPTIEEEKREREFKARDITNTGTCPCCGRNIKLDSRGTMVHHGFQRPGDGMGIVGDCFGVGYEPFEVSPKGTMELRNSLTRRKDTFVIRLGNLKAGKVTELRVRVGYGRDTRIEKLTPESDGWERAHKAAVTETEGAIRHLGSSIATLQESIDGWEPDDLPEVKARARGWRPANEWADSIQNDFQAIQA